MTLTLTMGLAALALAAILPLRWGLFGFLGAASALFGMQVAINAVTGFAGSSIEESLLLFNGSWISYIGFNLQITYRSFALPLLALSLIFIWRMQVARSTANA